jgi:hypothetical protein
MEKYKLTISWNTDKPLTQAEVDKILSDSVKAYGDQATVSFNGTKVTP